MPRLSLLRGVPPCKARSLLTGIESRRLKRHGDRPLKKADNSRVVDYEMVMLRRPKRNVRMLARLIAVVSMR